MKRMPRFPTSTAVRTIVTALGVAVLIIPHSAQPAVTDLSDIPLANAPTAEILPNIAFVFDDSGSMDEENMPDGDATNKGKNCYKWHGYNTLAYNPATTYLPPLKADGSRYADASFASALKDGYFANGVKTYNGSTTNAPVDLTAVGTVSTTTAKINFPDFGSTKRYATSLKVTLLDSSQIELLDSTQVPPSPGSSNEDTVLQKIAESINAQSEISGSGFTASYSTSNSGGYYGTLTITAPESQVNLATTPALTLSTAAALNHQAFSTTTVAGIFYATHKTSPTSTICDSDANYNTVTNKNSIAAPGTTAGSAAALTNYANWYSYYRKRAYMAKAAAGEAFGSLPQDKYRIGLFFIESKESESSQVETNYDLKIDKFSGTSAGTQRANWFDRLYGARQALYTPLRGALSRMGRMYAGKIADWDPVQYSCQRNFTILTTDGYWNTQAEKTTAPKYGPYKEDNTTLVGDQDGDNTCTTIKAPYCDKYKVSNTLADVAYYYYHTDLRQGSCAVCDNNVPPAGTNELVDDVATHQHMTTFTIGLGVNGTLIYQDGYKTSTAGDYYDIRQGTKYWPNPNDGNDEKIDDLWHAAVNGRGTYFSAKNTDTFVQGLQSALGTIESAAGSGAAAATSNLQPTAGDNFIYIANYRTVMWDGELSAYTIDLSTGTISNTAVWKASTLLDAKIGSLGDSDTRAIYTSSTGASALKAFTWSNLTATEQAYFDTTKLSQYADWSTTEKTAATGETLVNYLRGQFRYEDQDPLPISGFGTPARLYRDREKTLGDIVHSQPVYVKAPFYSFTDSGYSAFKSAQASRAGTVYVAANDGLLHAFDANTGQERWAYLPAPIMKNLWQLADKTYATTHKFFVDGPIAVSDVNIGGAWKTILVGSFGKGGRGYYALDITVPTAPVALWTFTADNNPNVGYSYGMPMITKLGDGTWVVLVTSGYNNIPEGSSYTTADGKGYLYVLNAATGAVIKAIGTNVGSAASPSGLAHLNVKVADFETNNTALRAYGGDLDGNMWRFDLDTGTASKVVALSSSQPITAPPELGEIDGKTILFFGTGSYLGQTDLSDTQTQSLYGIRDDGTTTVSVAGLVQQTISGSATRTVTANAVNWTTGYGWYANLVDSGERVNLPAQLYFGTVIFASTVPTATACQPGGYSWMYFLDFNTGGAIEGKTVAVQFTSPIVGITVARLPGGTPKVYAIKADGGIPKGEPPTLPISTSSTGSASSGRRVMWRELLD